MNNKVKCQKCSKKIKSLLPTQCKCKNYYCNKHKIPQDHECKYDYIDNNQKKIDDNNPIITFKKVEPFS